MRLLPSPWVGKKRPSQDLGKISILRECNASLFGPFPFHSAVVCMFVLCWLFNTCIWCWATYFCTVFFDFFFCIILYCPYFSQVICTKPKTSQRIHDFDRFMNSRSTINCIISLIFCIKNHNTTDLQKHCVSQYIFCSVL